MPNKTKYVPGFLGGSKNQQRLSLEYLEVEYSDPLRDMSCCCLPSFIDLLFEAVKLQSSLTKLHRVVSKVMRFRKSSQTLSRTVLGLLGQAMARNNDFARATVLADCMSEALCSMNPKRSGTSSSHYLGQWFYYVGLHEQAIPYLQAACLKDLDELPPVIDQPYDLFADPPASLDDLVTPASYNLEQSYRHLKSRELQTSGDSLRKPGENPFVNYLWKTLKPDIDLFLDGSTREEAVLQYVESRITQYRSSFFYLWDPKQSAKLYTDIATRYLNLPSPEASTSCLNLTREYLSAMRSADHCELCIGGLEELMRLMLILASETRTNISRTEDALKILISDVNNFASSANKHPDLGRRVFVSEPRFSWLLESEMDFVLEYIIDRRAQSSKKLHAEGPSLFSRCEFNPCERGIVS